MNFLKQEREVLDQLLPGLDDALSQLSLTEMERPGNPSINVFREMGGPGLLIPTALAGRGANPVQAVRVQRAVGSRAPSLAVATSMHHFSVASLTALAAAGTEADAALLESVARDNLYVASGFAEGKTGQSILASSMQVERIPEGLVLSGSKKPCSLSASMALLTVSLSIPPGPDDQAGGLAVAILPADSAGIQRRPFWASSVLAGAESDEVILRNVVVPDAFVAYLGSEDEARAMQTHSFSWFELLITASYLGIASALVERVILAGRGTPTERSRLAFRIEGAMAALETAAHSMTNEGQDPHSLARLVMIRFAVQDTIDRVTVEAAELLGGMAFVESNDVACLLASARGLAFHPPSRANTASSLDDYLAGQPFAIA